MIKYSEDYYKAETRNGFYIEELMKRAWAAQVEMLVILDDVCKRHGLSYYADGGTLLGAVRHQGFIPWDDDIDIVMKREDYNTLIHLPDEEFPGESILLSPYRTGVEKPIAYLVNGLRINREEEHLNKFHGFPYPAGIDIYPLDKLPENAQEERLLLDIIRIALAIMVDFNGPEEKKAKIPELVKQLSQLCNVDFDYNGNLQQQIAKLVDLLSSTYGDSQGEYVAPIVFYCNNENWKFKECWYDETVYLPFEGIKLPCPANYHEVLVTTYGDYMTPVQGGSIHDYPFYKIYQERERNEGQE